MDRGRSGLWLLVIHELRFKSNGRLIAQGTVTSALVIPALDADKELLAGGRVIGGHLSAQHFAFDFADGAFHPSIVIGITRATHAGDPAVVFQERTGLGAGVLHPAIRMDQQPFGGLALGLSHLERTDHQFAAQMIRHGPADNLAAPQVQHHAR